MIWAWPLVSGEVEGWANLLMAAGVGAVLLEAVRSIIHRKSMKADTAETITNAAVTLVAPLEKRVHSLESDLDEALQEVESLRGVVAELRSELSAAYAELEVYRRGHDAVRHLPDDPDSV